MAKKYTNKWFEDRGGKTWASTIDNSPISALEVGCYEGRASVWLLENFPELKLKVIDIFDPLAAEDWDGYKDDYEKRFDHNVKEFKKRVTKLKGKSFEYLAQEIVDGNRYDFIYIDGDHRKLQATQDMAMAIELLSDKGIMIVDDYKEIPWIFDAVNAFCDTLDSTKHTWYDTPDGSQKVIRRL